MWGYGNERWLQHKAVLENRELPLRDNFFLLVVSLGYFIALPHPCAAERSCTNTCTNAKRNSPQFSVHSTVVSNLVCSIVFRQNEKNESDTAENWAFAVGWYAGLDTQQSVPLNPNMNRWITCFRKCITQLSSKFDFRENIISWLDGIGDGWMDVWKVEV